MHTNFSIQKLQRSTLLFSSGDTAYNCFECHKTCCCTLHTQLFLKNCCTWLRSVGPPPACNFVVGHAPPVAAQVHQLQANASAHTQRGQQNQLREYYTLSNLTLNRQ